MKRLLFLLIFLILVSSVFAVETDVSFDGDYEISVTVILKEDFGSDFNIQKVEGKENSLKERREEVKEKQDKVLNRLNKQKSFGIMSVSTKKTEKFHRFSIVNGFTGKISKAEFEQLKDDPDVKGIYQNKQFYITLDDSTNLINSTLVNAMVQNYSTNLTGTGQTVCVIDTGIDYNHTALGGGWGNRVLDGYDYYNTDSDPFDDNGHGTHVAGIIGSNDSVYGGVAPNVNFVALKACDSAGSCDVTAMASAIDWCINNSATYNITVISMSIGSNATHNSSTCPSTLATEVNTAISAGLTFVVSSGNTANKNGISSPACLANSTSVGSVGNNDVIVSYSNSVASLDLLAPGGTSTGTGTCPDVNRICSANYGGGFISMSGTSMAAPHVSGAIALLNQYKKLIDNNTYTSAEVETILKSTGVNKTDSGNSLNFTRIDIYAAILSIDNVTPNVSYISPTPDNNTIIGYDSVTIKINASESVNAILEFNGTNYSMSLVSGAIYQKVLNDLSKGNYSYLVYFNDSASDAGVLNTRIFEINNSGPNITWFSPNATSVSILEQSSQLFNHTSNDTEDATLSYFWYLNGSLQVSTSSWNHTSNCSSKGDYNVTLIVSDGFLNDSQSWNLTVNETNCVPTVNILSPTNASVLELGNLTNFTSNVSDADGDNLSYSWTFGDGNPSTDANTTNNTFMSVNNFTVVLTVNDSNVTANDSIVVEVLDRVAPSFSSSTMGYSSTIYTGNNLSVSVNITDYSNITDVTLTHNNTLTQNSSPDVDTYSWLINTPANGSNSFVINATDVYTNFKNTTFSFTVNYCGDGDCDAEESCSNCSGDCGVCPTGSSGGGSSTDALDLPSRLFVYTSLVSGTGYDLNVNQENIPFTKISLTPSATKNNVKITVKVTETPPSTLSNVHKYLEIVLENINDSEISTATIDFKINKSWFSSNGYDHQKVSLHRYSDGKWNPIIPNKVSEISDAYVYSVTIPGFSYFAIGAEKVAATPTVATESDTFSTNAVPEPVVQELEEEPVPMESNVTDAVAEEEDNNYFWYFLLLIPVIAVIISVVYFTKYKGSDNESIGRKKPSTKRGEIIKHLVKEHSGRVLTEDELVTARKKRRKS